MGPRWNAPTIKFRVLVSCSLLLFFLLVFFLNRAFLLFLYPEEFSDLTKGEVAFAFLDGVRFDLATFFTLLSLPFLALNLPVNSKRWSSFWAAVTLLGCLFLTAIAVADTYYFRFVKRHLTSEPLVVLNDLEFLASYILKRTSVLLLVWITICVLAFLGLRLFLKKTFSTSKTSLFKELAYLTTLFCVGFFCVKGSFDIYGKPINIIDAYRIPKLSYGNLVLNGVFSTYQILRSKKDLKCEWTDSDKAFSLAKEVIVGEREELVLEGVPVFRRFKEFFCKDCCKRTPNLVILLLESWTTDYIDSLSGTNYGVTPNFDRLVSESLVFTNFFAAGQRSIHGIAAALVGIPTLPTFPYLGKGLESTNITRIAAVLKSLGYSTLMVQTSERRSYRMDAVAKALGFQYYYGAEDIPRIERYETEKSPAFGYDYEGLMFFKEKLDRLRAPFFAFFFSGTTHPPFVLLKKQFERYPHDPGSLNGYLNALFYSDWALGRFFEEAKKSPWFKNTVFVITADHTIGKFSSRDHLSRFKVPFIIYAPGLFPPKRIERVTSQFDILPTVFDLLCVRHPFSALGKSVFEDENRYALLVEGTSLGLVTHHGWIFYAGKRVVEAKTFNYYASREYLLELLLSLVQTSCVLIKENRWHPETRKAAKGQPPPGRVQLPAKGAPDD